jgi:hypothetical protein
VRTLTPNLLSKIPGAEAKIFDNLDALLDAMLALALGHKFQTSRFDKDAGEVVTVVWDVPPDYKALAFLIENVIGKVPSRVELTGKDGGAVRVIPWMTMDEAVRMGLRPSLELESGESDDEDTVDGEVIDVEA